MAGAVLGVFVPELVDDAAGHGGAEERGGPSHLFDFVAERVCIVGFFLFLCGFGGSSCGDLLPFARCALGVGDVAAVSIGQFDHFFDYGVAGDAVWMGHLADDADGGEGEGEGDGADGDGVGL